MFNYLTVFSTMISKIFLLCVICISPCIYGREYIFINLALTWREAQQFCRLQYSDLATVTSLEEAGRLNRQDNHTGLAWIGLFEPWTWSATGAYLLGFNNWRTNYPSEMYNCVSTSDDGKWFDHTCSHSHPFLCYTDGVPKQYHYVASSRRWADAMLYCRQHYTDLAVINNLSESDQVTSDVSATGSSFIWIGLHRDSVRAWIWADGTSSTFSNWGGSVAHGQCAAEDSAHRWFPQSCAQTLPFFCQGAKNKKYKPVRMKFISDLDMIDPNNYGKMLHQLEEELKQKGLTDISFTMKLIKRQKKNSGGEIETCKGQF